MSWFRKTPQEKIARLQEEIDSLQENVDEDSGVINDELAHIKKLENKIKVMKKNGQRGGPYMGRVWEGNFGSQYDDDLEKHIEYLQKELVKYAKSMEHSQQRMLMKEEEIKKIKSKAANSQKRQLTGIR